MTQLIAESFQAERFSALQQSLPGQVHRHGDEGYAAAIAGFSLSDQPTPDVVVTVSSAADVAAAVGCAREQDLGVGVMATGHNFGHPHEGGLFINTARMRAVTVDPEARTIRVEAGATWGEALLAAQAHDLAPPLRLGTGRRRGRLHDPRRDRLDGAAIRRVGAQRGRRRDRHR